MAGGTKDQLDYLDERLERLEGVVGQLEYFIDAFLDGENTKIVPIVMMNPTPSMRWWTHNRQGRWRCKGPDTGQEKSR